MKDYCVILLIWGQVQVKKGYMSGLERSREEVRVSRESRWQEEVGCRRDEGIYVSNLLL